MEIYLQKIMKINVIPLKTVPQSRCAFMRFICYNQYRIVLSTDQTFEAHFDQYKNA